MIIIMKRPQSDSSTISTNDLRCSFDRVLSAVKARRTLTLTYRNKPLARIVPIAEGEPLTGSDSLLGLADLAEPMGKLSNEELDAIIYGS